MATPKLQPETGGVLGDDIIQTPALPALVSEPDAHLATISGVSSNTYDSGATSLDIKATSQHTGSELTLNVWLPSGFVENIQVDPLTLPEEEGDEEAGIKKNKQRSSYARNIKNTKETATLQKFLKMAADNGRTISALGLKAPTTFEQLVDTLDLLLRDIQVVVLRRPDLKSEDSAYYGQLRVRSMSSPEIIDNAKALKGYRKLWEEE